MHSCDFCGTEYRSRITAALCCDAISNDLDDELDLDGTSINRTTD